MTITEPQIATLASLIPVATLVVGVTLGDRVAIPAVVSESFSYMTTGLLVALIALELIPEILHEAQSTKERVGAAFGFVTGAALLVGMLAAVDSWNRAKGTGEEEDAPPKKSVRPRARAIHGTEADANQAENEEPHRRLAFPAAAVSSSFILLLMYGLIIGIGLESTNNPQVVKTLALVTAGTISLDTFLNGVESAVLFKECSRPAWEVIVINAVGCGLLMVGAFTGGTVERFKHGKTGAFVFFFILGVATSCALSVVSQAQKPAAGKSEEDADSTRAWYPSIFMYVGFLIILHAQWYTKGLRVRSVTEH